MANLVLVYILLHIVRGFFLRVIAYTGRMLLGEKVRNGGGNEAPVADAK